ncbi:MAG: hypothetical protein ACRD0K_07295 [Egibacteraceae bacterium]
MNLPPGWELVGPPSRITASVVSGRAPVVLGAQRRKLADLPEGADGPGSVLRARSAGGGPPGELGIGFYAIGRSNEPGALLAELSGGPYRDEVVVVELAGGPALRRTGRRAGAFLRQFCIPVPATSDHAALLSFTGPRSASADDAEIFDAVATAFAFTWEDPQPRRRLEAHAREWAEQVSAEDAPSSERLICDPGLRDATETVDHPPRQRLTPKERVENSVVALLLFAYVAAVVMSSTISMRGKAPLLALGITVTALMKGWQGRRGWAGVGLAALALGALLATALGVYGVSGL